MCRESFVGKLYIQYSPKRRPAHHPDGNSLLKPVATKPGAAGHAALPRLTASQPPVTRTGRPSPG
jgi:hypothetical protein